MIQTLEHKPTEAQDPISGFPAWTPKDQLQVIGFDRRSEGVGGSEVAAILGMNPWAKPIDVWLKKTGNAPEDETNAAMEWGSRLEAVILDKYEAEAGKSIYRPGTLTLQRKDRPWHVMTCDALHITVPVGIEVKTASGYAKGWGEPGTDQVPEYYLTQIMWYMAGLGADSFDVAVLKDGRNYGVYRIERDEDLINILLEKVSEFWTKHVQADIPPAISHSDLAERYLKMKYPKAGANLRYADDEEIALARSLRTVRAELDALESRKLDLETQLKARIGEDKGLDTPIGSLVWTGGNPTTKTDWKGLASALKPSEAQIAEFSQETTTPRSFRVKFTDEE